MAVFASTALILQKWHDDKLLVPRIATLQAPLLNGSALTADYPFEMLIQPIGESLLALAHQPESPVQSKVVKDSWDFTLASQTIEPPFYAVMVSLFRLPPCGCKPRGWKEFGEGQPFHLTHLLLQAGRTYRKAPSASLTLLFKRGGTHISLVMNTDGSHHLKSWTPRVTSYEDFLAGKIKLDQAVFSGLVARLPAQEAFGCSERQLGEKLEHHLSQFLEDSGATRFHYHPAS